jgi:hypothetical protein
VHHSWWLLGVVLVNVHIADSNESIIFVLRSSCRLVM